MNYEKAYKEALGIAKDYYKANQKLGESEENEVLSDIFPELAESEDERIRKELIKVFSNREKYLIDQSFGNITVSEVLAWLEKQGESYTKRDVDDAYLKGISDAKNELEKQGDKPAWSEEDEKNLRRAIRATQVVYPVAADWLKSLRPQNRWGPSDEQIGILEEAMYQVGILTPLGSKINGLCEQLKKLREGEL